MRILDLLPDEMNDELLPIIEECERVDPRFSYGYDPEAKLMVYLIWLARDVVRLRAEVATLKQKAEDDSWAAMGEDL